MIGHPLLIAVAVLDFISLTAVLSAASTAFQTVLNWNPGSAGRDQILLERRAEAAAIAGRFGLVGFILSSTIMLIGISNVLPGIVPGAMCGTGVCQAADGLFGRAIMFRIACIAVLFFWLGLDRLNRSRPEAPLSMLGARVLLIVVPLQAMASYDTLYGSLRLDVRSPVNCCTVAYDQVRVVTGSARSFVLPEAYLVWAFIVLSAVLIGIGSAVAVNSRFRSAASGALLAFSSALWVPLAALALVRVFSAYIYGVLHHQCPWCLFLAEHHFIGFPLFLCLVVVGLEGVFVWIAAALRRKYPELGITCLDRIRGAALHVVVAAGVFCLITGLPAIFWRIRYGVWIFG
jgi:hypothetical protein